MHCAQTAEDIDTVSYFAYTTALKTLSDGVKMLADSGQPLLPQILPQSEPPLLIRHSMANCGQMISDSTMVTMDTWTATAIDLSNGTILDPDDLPFPQNGGPAMSSLLAPHRMVNPI